MEYRDRDGAEPGARLHLHRGWGGIYLSVSIVLFALVLAGLVGNLLDGRLLLAAVTLVVGLAIAAFLAKVGLELLLPALTADGLGIRGRINAVGARVDAAWPEIDIDLDTDATPGRFALRIAGVGVAVDSRSWFGFRDFLLVVASTPAATGRLSPAARDEVVRLLGIRPPMIDADNP